MINTKPVPFDYSRFERTYNRAIDLVAQYVGYNRKMNKPLKAIYLQPTYYDLFRMGFMLLRKANGVEPDFDPNTIMYFDGVELKRGSPMQFDSIRCEYYTMAKA